MCRVLQVPVELNKKQIRQSSFFRIWKTGCTPNSSGDDTQENYLSICAMQKGIKFCLRSAHTIKLSCGEISYSGTLRKQFCIACDFISFQN